MHFGQRLLGAAAVVCMAAFALLGSTADLTEKRSVTALLPQQEQKETIYVGYSDEALSSYIASAAVAFGEREEVHVLPVLLDDNAYLEAVNRLSVNGEAQMPDVYVLPNDSLERAYLSGLASPVEDGGAVCNDVNFPQTALQAVTYQGEIVAYPFYYNTCALLYNKTYLQQWMAQQQEQKAQLGEEPGEDETAEDAGEDGTQEDEAVSMEEQISPEGIPYTMEALLYIADTFDVPEGVEGIMKWDVSDIFYNYWLIGNYLIVGGEAGDDPARIDIDNPETIACLAFYQSLNQFFSMEADTSSYAACIQDFIEGKTVFTVVSAEAVRTLGQAKAEGAIDFAYGFAKMPDVTKDLQSRSLSMTESVAVNGYSSHRELANRFAGFLTKEYAEELYERTGKVSAVRSVNAQDPYLAVFAQEYADSVSLPKLMEIGNLWLQLETLFAKVWNGDEAAPLVQELSAQILSQLIMR